MKKIILVIFIASFYHASLFSQNESNYFVEVNLAKTTVTQSLFSDSKYKSLSYINGFRVGRLLNNNSEYYIAIQKEISTSDLALIGEYSTIRHQVALGANFELFAIKKLKCNFGGELLINFNEYSGYYTNDMISSTASLNNLTTTEAGASTILQLNYSISPKLAIILNSRIGVYHRGEKVVNDLTIDKSSHQIFEPLNMLGLRINL